MSVSNFHIYMVQVNYRIPGHMVGVSVRVRIYVRVINWPGIL